MSGYRVPCALCGDPVDPRAETTARQVVGWEFRRRTRATGTKGGSDIVEREPTGQFACWQCIRRLREGVATTQITFV